MIYIGTSGWSYTAWEEKFYRQKMSGLEQLKFYAGRFSTVEINYSFYHIPKVETFKKWAEATPEDFVFAIKLNRLFTHDEQLVVADDTRIKLEKFLQNAGVLKKRFAVLLIQTPKSLTYDFQRLGKFLKVIDDISKKLVNRPRLAFEFRNKGWLNEKTYNLLRTYKSAVVFSQSPGIPESRVVTSDIIYIRLHGPSKMFDSEYSTQELEELKAYADGHPQINNIYIYFNNTMRGQAINNAQYLQGLFNYPQK